MSSVLSGSAFFLAAAFFFLSAFFWVSSSAAMIGSEIATMAVVGRRRLDRPHGMKSSTLTRLRLAGDDDPGVVSKIRPHSRMRSGICRNIVRKNVKSWLVLGLLPEVSG